MDSERESAKLLIFNGLPENFWVGKKDLSLTWRTRTLPLITIHLATRIGAKNKNSLYRDIIMHLDDKTLQMVISLDTTDGEEVWNHLQVTYGKIKNSLILAIWEEFLGFKVEPGETLLTFLNRLDVTIY